MFIVFLTFTDHKALAAEHMQDHNSWIQQGFDDGIFLLVGSLQPNQGGAIIADNISAEDLTQRINQDPFVQKNIVKAQLHEICPARANSQLSFLVS